MAATVRLAGAVEALAALAAHVRTETEGLDVDPAIARLLGEIATEITGTADAPPADVAAQSLGLSQALLREAIGLIEDPGRNGDWSRTDPAVLQGLGRLSTGIATALALSAPGLAGLEHALAAPSARILDVGTGTGWLAIALARTFPGAHVVGIDIWDPALTLARGNVEREGLGDRVELRAADITSFDETEAYDVVWLPLPFIPRATVAPAIVGAARALRPGGWLVAGTFPGPGDRLGDLLVELRILRCGGHPWSADELGARIADAGLVDAHVIPQPSAAPVRFHVGRRAIG
jgi:SAM-dependent methyltransferase